MWSSSSKILVVATLASVVSAQDSVLNSLSASCTAALKGLLFAPEAQCLNTAALVPLTASGGTIDVPTLVNKWLLGLCASGSCSQASLRSIVTNVTAGCAQDVKTFLRFDISDPETVLPYVTQYYPPIRQIACLRDDGANALCVPQTITNLQGIIGPLGVDDLNMDTIIADAKKIASADYKNLACTSCTKQAYTIAASVFPDRSLLSTIEGPITDTCGASFIDGQNVTTVTQTAVAGEFNAQSPSSGTISFKPSTLGGTVLFMASATFSFLI